MTVKPRYLRRLFALLGAFTLESCENASPPQQTSRDTATAASLAASTPHPVDSVAIKRSIVERRRLHADTDSFSGAVVLYRPPLTRYVNSRTSLTPYYAGSGSSYTLWMRVSYVADDWLFVQSVTVKTDSATYELTPEPFGAKAVERDNADGRIWEWWTVFGDEQLVMLLDIVHSKRVRVRFNGRQYYKDWTMPAADLAAIRETIDALPAVKNWIH